MMTITKITNIDNKKHIALLDTSSISFMQGLHEKGITSEEILKDYDLILIPEWDFTAVRCRTVGNNCTCLNVLSYICR